MLCQLDLSSGADEAQQAHSAAENGGRSSTTTQGPQLSASLSLRSTSSDLPPMGAGAKVAYNEDLTRIIMEHLLDAKDRNASPGLSVRPYLTICKVWKQRLDEIRNDLAHFARQPRVHVHNRNIDNMLERFTREYHRSTGS